MDRRVVKNLTRGVVAELRRRLAPLNVVRTPSRFHPSRLKHLATMAMRAELPTTFRMVDRLRARGCSAGEVLLDVLGEAARLVDHWYRTDRCTSTERSIGLGSLCVLARYAGRRMLHVDPPHQGSVAVITLRRATPSLDPLLHHLYAEAAGWNVEMLEGSTESDVLAYLATVSVDVALISVTAEREVKVVERIVRAGSKRSVNPAITFAAMTTGRGAFFLNRRVDRVVHQLLLDPCETHTYLRQSSILTSTPASSYSWA